MNIKPQTIIPAGVTITRGPTKVAKGLEPVQMRAKGTGAPPESAILRGQATAVVARIKGKARIARTTDEDMARALCFLKYGG